MPEHDTDSDRYSGTVVTVRTDEMAESDLWDRISQINTETFALRDYGNSKRIKEILMELLMRIEALEDEVMK